MRKSTFYELTTLCGLGALFFGYLVLTPRTSCCHPPESRVDGDFSSIGSAMMMYCVNAGRPPTTAQGLDVLVNEPTVAPKPRRWTRAMEKAPTDPWGTPYRYALLAPKEREWRWELRSAGQDGVFGSSDDIVGEYDSGASVVPDATQAGEKVDPRPSF